MRQAVLTFMSGHLATKKDQQTLKKSFLQFDENGDGLIQEDEFIKGFKVMNKDKTLSDEDLIEMAKKIFKEADTDGSGEIDFDEWCTATIN